MVDQICETMGSEEKIQAGCVSEGLPRTSRPRGYVPEHGKAKIAIVAFRGTSSQRGVFQDIALGMPFFRRAIKHAIAHACSYVLLTWWFGTSKPAGH